MKNVSVDTHRKFLKINFFVLRYTGIWPLLPSAKIGWKILNIFYKYFNLIAYIFYLITVGADALANVTDLTIFGCDGCFFFGTSMMVYKSYKFSVRQKEITKLTDEVYGPIDILLQSSDRGIVINIKRQLFYETIQLYSLYISIVITTFALIFLVPREKGLLPIRAIYPFDTTVSPNYELTIFYQFYCVAYILLMALTVDSTMIGLMRWLTIQVLALTNNYKNCDSKLTKRAGLISPDESYRTFSEINLLKIKDQENLICKFLAFKEQEIKDCNDNFTGRFKTCIRNYERIRKIVNNVNTTFSVFLLIQFATSLLIICLNGFMIILADTLTHNQWMSGWECAYERNNNNELSNLVTTSMIPTLKPLQFKAGDMFALSMPTFLMIVKSSYSTLVLLTTVVADG
ncbi:GSCOCT00002623001.3-RA-CDS [Cotesia congregata]|uniref:Odorant receptor n=1 Tax=Cotesia congregata TaxID=51543 RepID=A0A8J2HN11_COTCN|nr:GSCOCT00002623001.3-RA-CDS [Cotesia congregata]CAG5101724.1 olfactory receptor 43 [Cotesia congregata]